MVILNTGLKDSPKDDEVTPNHNLQMPSSEGDTDSESEQFEDAENIGDYMRIPCSSNSEDEHNIYSSEEESVTNTAIPENREQMAGPSVPVIERIETTLVKELWSQPSPTEVNFTLDSAKIEQVKEAMSKVTLPLAAIPEWAKNIPEEEWKERLIKKLQVKDNKV